MSIYDEYKRFPDVHPNIVLRVDLARQGLAMGRAASEQLGQMEDVCWKGYHFFSYEHQETKLAKHKVPRMVRLEDGSPIEHMGNANSPYVLDFVDGEFVITENNEPIAKGIYFDPKPKWFGMKLEDGTPIEHVIEGTGRRRLFLTFNFYCEFWNTHDECLFCNINATLRDKKAGGEDIEARRTPEHLAEAVEMAMVIDPLVEMGLISGGTILGKYRGQTELEFYCSRIEAIRDRLEKWGRWKPPCVQLAAYDDDGWKRVRDAGVGRIQSNIEVWDKRLFEWICPGKNKFIGYDEWIRRTIRAVDIFGVGNVITNFVIGVEMAKPYGFKDVSSAIKSTASGWDFLMSHGVLPRYRPWCIEAGSSFVGQEVPPLEYFMEAEKAHAELRWKHGFLPWNEPQVDARHPTDFFCHWDWDYYHGTGPYSKQKMEAKGFREK
jgi:hypothetical protein